MLVPRSPATRIALVNNMPDGAFDATEAQFVALVRAASVASVDVSLYTLPGLERGAATQASLDERYRALDELWDDPPDAVIVTGTEPCAADLASEAYWPALEQLVTWAEGATVSTLLSCLAAHAALRIFDGIDREPLPQKCSGLFPNEVLHPHPLVKGVGDRMIVPHSRLNDVPTGRLVSAGYTPLVRAQEAGWAVAVKQRGECLFVLCQGHLEYGTDTLLREYRRDVRRFLAGERAEYPPVPVDYIDPEAAERLVEFRAAVLAGAEHGAEPNFPYECTASGLTNSWRRPARRFYANWLRHVAARARTVHSRERVRS